MAGEDEVLDAVEVAADEQKLARRAVPDGVHRQGAVAGMVAVEGRGQGRGTAAMVVERDVVDHVAHPGGRDSAGPGHEQGVEMLRPQGHAVVAVVETGEPPAKTVEEALVLGLGHGFLFLRPLAGEDASGAQRLQRIGVGVPVGAVVTAATFRAHRFEHRQQPGLLDVLEGDLLAALEVGPVQAAGDTVGLSHDPLHGRVGIVMARGQVDEPVAVAPTGGVAHRGQAVGHLLDEGRGIDRVHMGVMAVPERLVEAGVVVQVLPRHRERSLGELPDVVHQPGQGDLQRRLPHGLLLVWLSCWCCMRASLCLSVTPSDGHNGNVAVGRSLAYRPR